MALAGERARPRPVFSPTIDAVVRESPCDIAVVKQRGLDRSSRSWCRCAAAPTPSWPCASAATSPSASGRRWSCCTWCRRGSASVRSSASRRRSMRFVREHAGTRRATGLIREASSVRQAIIKEAANHQLVVMGASAQPTNASPDGRYLFGTLAESVASKAKPTVIVVKTKQSLGLATFDELRASEGTLAHADAYVERSRSLPVVVDRWFAENTFHAHEFCRHPQARGAQGAAEPHCQRRAAGAERGEDDRHRHQAREGRADGPRAAHRPDRGHRLGQRRTAPSRSPPSWACRCTGTARSCRRPAATSARARRCGRASTCSTATSWPGSTPTSATSSRDSSTACSARCWTSRGSSTSRASTSGRSARATSSSPRAAAA